MNLTFREKIIEKAISMGASKVGFAKLENFLPDNFSHLKTGISIIVRLSDQIMNDVVDKPTHTYFHHYRTVNFLIDQITLAITIMIQNEGYLAMAIPASQTVKTKTDAYTGIFQHKTVATLAGLGWIGKNACLVTEEFGPRIRLGTVLTNMILPYDEPIRNSKCGNCNICVKKCPALALKGNNWYQGMDRDALIDAFACSSYMSEQYKDIGRGSVCGLCISSCPKGTKIIRK
ncbi:Epoxyqueuosine reductase QueG (queuosine biosynthesis) [Caloranaerobacter azorensis DSM 13643]|uniref:Epoxyqueuosine reductase QueG (Queuosine biosynthesis) n=1 Tax=Caloranaerobacter azorensis DSM 13643 TaxID=1121264 RepID=A0A1M5RA18_9FIRM|nr:4Fe-4S dicluster domain-containing protein [Caloranaerobacter azorensis]SHH23165.1 Epoxyqueuosine reductase QueG (queuosine biosynthesis) [Caloranaerobacter azorensis DSM 13643]